MGGVESKSRCKYPLDPDILSVLTLSDSAVQRLPLELGDDGPLERESRQQNIDDFWRDRLECLEHTHMEVKKITEKEFQRLEYAIKQMAPEWSGMPACPRMVEDAKTCYITYPGRSLNCSHVIQTFDLCLNTVLQEAARKRLQNDKKKVKKPKPC